MPGAFELAKLYATHIYEAAVNVRDNQRAFKYNLPKERGTSYLTLSTTLEQLQQKEVPSTVRQLGSKTEQLARLTSALRYAESDSSITCGGSVFLNQLDSPLVLRFDKGKSSQSKVDFYSAVSAANNLPAQIECLVSQCQEATFGVGGRDVLDQKYRKALKMDPADFSINFHPFDCGIIDCVCDLLLPEHEAGGLHVQLYKLNIYEAGGKFKSHVDTPRSLNQFGSLVVYLPSAHQGGELVIRHQGHTTTHSWGDKDSSLAWAAFYSDCEHEVLEVTSGFRITLTYNLYWTPLVEPRAAPPLSIHHIPLFKEVQEALRDLYFLPRGGTIGFRCAHLYPRNRQGRREGVPYCLKGVDRVLWMALQSFNIRQGVHLVFDKRKVDDDAQEADERDFDTEDYENAIDPEARRSDTESGIDDDSDVEILSEDRGKKYCAAHEPKEDDTVKAYRHQVAETGRPPALEYDNEDPLMLPQSTFEKRLDQLLDSRSIKGIDLYPTTPEYPGRDRVSRVFGPARDSHCTEEWDGKTAVRSKPGSDIYILTDSVQMLDESTSEIRGIRWLNDQRNMEMALAYLAVSVKVKHEGRTLTLVYSTATRLNLTRTMPQLRYWPRYHLTARREGRSKPPHDGRNQKVLLRLSRLHITQRLSMQS